jgi:hypothetical protein
MSIIETVVHRTAEGRSRRVGKHTAPTLASRDRILLRTRELMRSGVLRPRTEEICVGIITPIAINNHFETMATLYNAALEDNVTRHNLLSRLMPNGGWPSADDCDRIFRAIFLGRFPQ